MRRIIVPLGFCLCLLALALLASESPLPAQRLSVEQRVDGFVASLPDEFNGTILLAVGDSILMNKGYGWANRAFHIPNTAETVYELASVTKDFTTVLAFKLVEEGLLELDATVDTYLPDFPAKYAGKITVRHLLLHQSGIKHHLTGIPSFLGFHDRVYHTPRELLELFQHAELAHEPGAGTTYSSPGYWLLTVIMETAGGKSFAELLREHIFEPLGMGHTYVDNNLTVRENQAIGYKKGLGGYVMDLKEVHANNLGAGDMVGTTGDLYRLQRILSPDSGAVLSPTTRRVLFEEQSRISDRFVRTMLATLKQTPFNGGRDTLRVFGIGAGGSYGFQSKLTRLVDYDAAYIVLSNMHSDRTMNEQMYDFLQDVLCEERGIPLKVYQPLGPLADSEEPRSVSVERLRAYEGMYRVADNDVTQVYVQDGRLRFRGYESSFYDRVEVRGGELISLGDGLFFERNGFVPRYFLFVIPSELTAEHPCARFSRLLSDAPDQEQPQLVRMGLAGTNAAFRWSPDSVPDIDLTAYEGSYYSVELQKTYTLDWSNRRLVATGFLGREDLELTPFKEDRFSSEQGFFVFHRYEDGSVRDFWLMSETLDHVYGSLFIRKW